MAGLLYFATIILVLSQPEDSATLNQFRQGGILAKGEALMVMAELEKNDPATPEIQIATKPPDSFEGILKRFTGRPAVIISGREGKRIAGSFHPLGKALDLRARDLSPDQRENILHALRRELGPDFDIIYEADRPGSGDHFHLEYDPK